MSAFFSVRCLISGVAGQAGSPETVWRIEDLYGELHPWRRPHGCLQRGSRWRSPALLRRRLILEGQLGKPVWPWPWGKEALDLAIRTHQTGFPLQGQQFFREEKGLCMVWRNSWYPRLSSGHWMTGWENVAYLIVILSVLGSVVSASCRNSNTFRWLGVLNAKFETCVMWESVSCQHTETDDIMAFRSWEYCSLRFLFFSIFNN